MLGDIIIPAYDNIEISCCDKSLTAELNMAQRQILANVLREYLKQNENERLRDNNK